MNELFACVVVPTVEDYCLAIVATRQLTENGSPLLWPGTGPLWWSLTNGRLLRPRAPHGGLVGIRDGKAAEESMIERSHSAKKLSASPEVVRQAGTNGGRTSHTSFSRVYKLLRMVFIFPARHRNNTLNSATIIDLGFSFVGAWTSKNSRPNQAASIKLKPGVYALVVGDSVMYVSHAAFLDRRLRTHTRQAFWGEKARTTDISSKIASSVEHGHEVLVFVKLLPSADIFELQKLEAGLVASFKPPWNRSKTHIARSDA